MAPEVHVAGITARSVPGTVMCFSKRPTSITSQGKTHGTTSVCTSITFISRLARTRVRVSVCFHLYLRAYSLSVPTPYLYLLSPHLTSPIPYCPDLASCCPDLTHQLTSTSVPIYTSQNLPHVALCRPMSPLCWPCVTPVSPHVAFCCPDVYRGSSRFCIPCWSLFNLCFHSCLRSVMHSLYHGLSPSLYHDCTMGCLPVPWVVSLVALICP